MDSATPVSLSDIVPALRWTHPRTTAEALGDARLPENWWLSEPLARALATIGAERVSGALATLALREWEHLPLTDLVPALYVATVDPGLPKWPVEIRDVVTGHVAGWEELLRLRPYDITRWAFGPGTSPTSVIDTVFAEVIGRLPASPGPARRPDAELMSAARTIADWMPDSAPEDVRTAVARLLTATADAADTASPAEPGDRRTPMPNAFGTPPAAPLTMAPATTLTAAAGLTAPASPVQATPAPAPSAQGTAGPASPAQGTAAPASSVQGAAAPEGRTGAGHGTTDPHHAPSQAGHPAPPADQPAQAPAPGQAAHPAAGQPGQPATGQPGQPGQPAVGQAAQPAVGQPGQPPAAGQPAPGQAAQPSPGRPAQPAQPAQPAPGQSAPLPGQGAPSPGQPSDGQSELPQRRPAGPEYPTESPPTSPTASPAPPGAAQPDASPASPTTSPQAPAAAYDTPPAGAPYPATADQGAPSHGAPAGPTTGPHGPHGAPVAPTTGPHGPHGAPADPTTGPHGEPTAPTTGPHGAPTGPSTGPHGTPASPTTGPHGAPAGPSTGPHAVPQGSPVPPPPPPPPGPNTGAFPSPQATPATPADPSTGGFPAQDPAAATGAQGQSTGAFPAQDPAATGARRPSTGGFPAQGYPAQDPADGTGTGASGPSTGAFPAQGAAPSSGEPGPSTGAYAAEGAGPATGGLAPPASGRSTGAFPAQAPADQRSGTAERPLSAPTLNDAAPPTSTGQFPSVPHQGGPATPQPGTGPHAQPSVGPQAAQPADQGTHPGPTPQTGTGPHAAPGPQEGPGAQPGTGPHAAGAPQVGTGPHAAASSHTGTGPAAGASPGMGPHTAGAPQAGTGPHTAAAAQSGTGPQVGGRQGEQARPGTGPQASERAGAKDDTLSPGVDLVEVVDSAFRGWDPLERAIATDRLFAAEPVSVRTLAHRLEADRDGLRRAQRQAEERMLDWLSSPAAAPFNAHLRALSDRLGVVATLDQLIAVHPQHALDVPELRTPLWRVIVALLSDRRLQEGWLIRGDLRQLRDLTRRLLPDRPTVAEAAEMLRRIGIREETVPAWLAATPGLRVSKGRVEAPGGVGLADEHGTGGAQHAADPRFTGPEQAGPPGEAPQAPAASAPGPEATGEGEAATSSSGLPMRRPPKPYATGVGPPAPPMSAIRAASVAVGDGPPRPPIGDSPRCFRGTDGRWWHRIDVTTAHLQGGPVPVPEGYAGHLGLRPGGVLSVTGPGNDVLVIVWRDVPAFDSLRPLLRRLPAAAGDHVFVSISGCELEARKLASLGPQGGTIGPAERALRLIGYAPNNPATPEEAVRIISQRVGATHDLGLDELIKRLRVRGDQDILSQLEAATARRV